MFDDKDKRYMTKAVAESLHPEIQMLLWQLIDHQKEQGKELDYLQVFELVNKNNKQEILHRQEVPPSETKWFIPLKNTTPIYETVWCMDDGENQVMMYPSDY